MTDVIWKMENENASLSLPDRLPRGPRGLSAHLLRDFARGFLNQFDDFRQVVDVVLCGRAADADARDHAVEAVEDRRGDAAHAVIILLIVHGVALLADARQFLQISGADDDGL